MSLDHNHSPLLNRGAASIKSFVGAFRAAQTFSIDAFLSRRSDCADIGKRAVALLLLECESKCALFREAAHNDHWYQYLVNELAEETWEEFDPSWLSVVTFNYDRSFEAYLLTALQAIYLKPEAEVVERLRSMKIVHVYGSLGSPWPTDSDFLPMKFNESRMESVVDFAARRIKVIPEGRDDEDTLVQARQTLADASRICFLGFGFDATNIRRLGAPDVFLTRKRPKHIVATALGLTPAERRRAAVRILGEEAFTSMYLDGFKDLNCIQLLRDTLILD